MSRDTLWASPGETRLPTSSEHTFNRLETDSSTSTVILVSSRLDGSHSLLGLIDARTVSTRRIKVGSEVVEAVSVAVVNYN